MAPRAKRAKICQNCRFWNYAITHPVCYDTIGLYVKGRWGSCGRMVGLHWTPLQPDSLAYAAASGTMTIGTRTHETFGCRMFKRWED